MSAEHEGLDEVGIWSELKIEIIRKYASAYTRILRNNGRFPLTPMYVDGRCEHIWWGVSVEDKKYGVPRIAHLRKAPARVRFLSIEPLLEDIGTINLNQIHWVIVGGESGYGARGMEKNWVRSLREQCKRAKVPFFFKQWGGVRKHKTGRSLDGHEYNQLPVLNNSHSAA